MWWCYPSGAWLAGSGPGGCHLSLAWVSILEAKGKNLSLIKGSPQSAPSSLKHIYTTPYATMPAHLQLHVSKIPVPEWVSSPKSRQQVDIWMTVPRSLSVGP